MKNFFNYGAVTGCIVIAIYALACQKTAPSHDVISIHATSMQVLADGSALDTIYADLPINASDSSLAVTFQASSGLFSNGIDTMTVNAARTDIDKGKITAVVVFTASLRPGLDTITASTNTVPEVLDQLHLMLNPSADSTLLLTPSAFGVQAYFGSEITITGTLFNNKGGMVSLGAEVKFNDEFASNNQAVNGLWRQVVNYSNDSSQVSAIYSPGPVASGQFINLIGTVYNSTNGVVATSTIQVYVLPFSQ